LKRITVASQPRLRVLLTSVEIAARVKELADKIRRDYHDKYPLLVGVLTGSFVFLSDLVRLLDFPLEVDFIRVSSYGGGQQSSGKVKVEQGLRHPIKGRHVLVVEDIVDTGLTISFLLDYLQKESPASVKLCALTDKPSRRRFPVNIDYLAFTVPNRFVVGYGLDWDEKFRNLPDICLVEDEGQSSKS